MDVFILLYIVTVAFTAVTGQQVVMQPKVYSSPGQTVNLSCVFTDATGVLISQVSWIYETEGRRINIAAFVPNNAPAYPESPLKDRVNFSPSPPVLASPSIQIRDVKKTDEGKYMCSFGTLAGTFENVTNLEMLEKIVNASVTPSTNQTVEGNSVNLTCEAAGSVFSRKWMKNGAELTESDNMMFYNEGRVLTFLSLKKTDRGQYSCNISNPLSSDEAKYDMLVYFGPENVHIQGPSTLSVNEILTLTCSAESIPPPTFTWKLNETVIPCTSAVLKKNITDVSESGKYICEVMNGVTGRHSSAVHELTVTLAPGPRPKPRCPAGCIAGSVIGCLVFIALCGVLVFVLLRKKKMQKKTSKRDTSTRTGGEGQTNAAFPGNQEVNYADVRFYRNRDGGTVNLGTENNTSEYAQVRVNSRPAAASSLPTYDAHMQRTTAPAHLSGAYGAQQYAQVRK